MVLDLSSGNGSENESFQESDNDSAIRGHEFSDADSDRNSSFHPDSVHGSSKTQQDSVVDSIARKDTKAACHLRVLVIALFIFMSVFVPIIIYITARKNEENSFNSEFDALATKVVDSFEFNVARKLGAIDSLDISVTSYAVGMNLTFPFVTIPDFDLRSANTLALADTFSVFLVPLVLDTVRSEWEVYSANNKNWIEQALNRKVATSRRRLGEFHDYIYRFDDQGNAVPVAANQTQYFPIWQNAPVFEDLVNFDLLSIETYSEGILAMLKTEEAVLGKVTEFKVSEKMLQNYFDSLLPPDSSNYGGEPISSLFYPVFDRFGSNRTLVSLFSMVIFWHTYFEGVSDWIMSRESMKLPN